MKRFFRSAERTVILGYVLSLLGILALAFASYEIPRQLVQTARQSAHSHGMTAKIEEIARDVLDAESTGRAYVITGNPDVLDRYHRVLPEIDRDVQGYRELTQGDPDRAVQLARLQGQIADRFKVMNEALNARNLFAQPGPTPEFRRNQYGVTLGGPVQTNKTFFFTDWQGTRLRTGITRFSVVPTLEQRQGIVTQSITIPRERFDTVAKQLLEHYPLPNFAGASNFVRTATEPDNQVSC